MVITRISQERVAAAAPGGRPDPPLKRQRHEDVTPEERPEPPGGGGGDTVAGRQLRAPVKKSKPPPVGRLRSRGEPMRPLERQIFRDYGQSWYRFRKELEGKFHPLEPLAQQPQVRREGRSEETKSGRCPAWSALRPRRRSRFFFFMCSRKAWAEFPPGQSQPPLSSLVFPLSRKGFSKVKLISRGGTCRFP